MHYYSRMTLYIEDKYGSRVMQYMMTGDPTAVDPNYVEPDPYEEFRK